MLLHIIYNINIADPVSSGSLRCSIGALRLLALRIPVPVKELMCLTWCLFSVV